MAYQTGEQRAAAEDAALAEAEAEFNGTTTDLHPEDTPTPEPETPTAEEVDWEKRYKDLQSYHDKTTGELKGQLKELTGGEPTTEEEVAELKAQLETLKGIEQGRETESLVAEAQQRVGQAHPDFVGIIQSTEFAEWIKEQPQVFQDAIYADRPDAQMAINALTLYKTSGGYNQRQEATQQQQMLDQAAMSVNSGHREQPQSEVQKTWTWAEINSLSPSQYDKLEAEIDTAIAEGRVR